jgi:cytochrome b
MTSDTRSTVKVWDAFVRIAHWSLVVSVSTAWLTRHSDNLWHEWLGYAALAIVVLRIIWGLIGSTHARFGDFVRTPAATLTYTKALIGHREPRYLGHNPLGAWMIVALLATVALLGVTGWLSTTDAYWGIAWVADSHEALSDFLLVLIALHVVGVVFSSLRHHENLVKAMITGRKPSIGDDRTTVGDANAARQRN